MGCYLSKTNNVQSIKKEYDISVRGGVPAHLYNLRHHQEIKRNKILLPPIIENVNQKQY